MALRSIDGGKAARGGRGTPKGEGSLDPFTMDDDGEYREDRIYTRATDGHGHSVQIQTRLAPALTGEIQALIESKMIPEYRTGADFMRDAAVHRLWYVSQKIKNKELERAVTTEMRRARTEARRVEMLEMAAVVNEQLEALAQSVSEEDWEMLSQLLDDANSEDRKSVV